ncbi:helix-turn-helix domain-containing protein [Alteromonas mediterranea]|uniref:helix-turn-helix domain-containing protein n=1 Tax=Alteromonas mediterranea TaxID=314275 RepID=UPI0039C88566
MDKKRGERITNLMREKGFTRDEFAMRSGYSISTISKIRNGHDFTTDVQAVLCSLLETTPNYLHGFTDRTPQIEHISSKLTTHKDPRVIQLIHDFLDICDTE